MSVSAYIRIPGEFGPEDIADILRSTRDMVVTVHPASTPGMTEIRFTEAARFSYYHFARGGDGTAYMSMAADGAEKYLKPIVDVTGGYWCPNDCEGRETRIIGVLNPEDGLAYLLKYAATHGFIRPDEQGRFNDLGGLIEAARTWNKKFGRKSYLGVD